MKKFKVLAFILPLAALVVFFAACSNPAGPSGQLDQGNGYEYYEYDDPPGFTRVPPDYSATVRDQLRWLRDNASDNGRYIVWARLPNENIPGGQYGVLWAEGSFGLAQNAQNVTVRISSYGSTRRTLTLDGAGSLLSASDGHTLILYNIDLIGCAANTAPMVIVENNAGLVLQNAVIRDNGGRGIEAIGGQLTMNNGAVIRNNAIGVFLDFDGNAFIRASLTMNDGSQIHSNNNTLGFGGGVHAVHSDIVMNGTAMIGGAAPAQGNVSNGSGGGVTLDDDSALTMNGGTIQNNRSGAVGGGAALFNGSRLTMNGGSILNNTAGTGGGVSLATSSRMEMFGNARVHGNFADGTILGVALGGGGVAIGQDSALDMRGEVAISGNQASGNGGGVYLSYSGAALRISDGRISGASSNRAPSGVAVYIANGSAWAGTFPSDDTFNPTPDGEISNTDTDISVVNGLMTL